MKITIKKHGAITHKLENVVSQLEETSNKLISLKKEDISGHPILELKE